MTTLNSFSTQVLIIGAGPTGLTLANLLGQANVDTLIIDRKPLGELAKALAEAQVEVLEAPALTRPEW